MKGIARARALVEFEDHNVGPWTIGDRGGESNCHARSLRAGIGLRRGAGIACAGIQGKLEQGGHIGLVAGRAAREHHAHAPPTLEVDDSRGDEFGAVVDACRVSGADRYARHIEAAVAKILCGEARHALRPRRQRGDEEKGD